MESTPKVASYGTWESPITSEMLSRQTITLSDTITDPKTGYICYLEERPAKMDEAALLPTLTARHKMKENDADVKTVFFEGEGHGFRKADSRKRAVEEEEA